MSTRVKKLSGKVKTSAYRILQCGCPVGDRPLLTAEVGADGQETVVAAVGNGIEVEDG